MEQFSTIFKSRSFQTLAYAVMVIFKENHTFFCVLRKKVLLNTCSEPKPLLKLGHQDLNHVRRGVRKG